MKLLKILIMVCILCTMFVFAENDINSEIEIDLVISEDITSSSAKISWSTNIAANSKVEYGETLEFGLEQINEDLTVEHIINLDDLNPGSDYYYSIISCIDVDNCVSSGTYSFITSQTIADSDSEEDSEEEVLEGESSSVPVDKKVTTQFKGKGSTVVTKNGIFQTYQLNKPKKLLVLPTSIKKVVPKIVELIEMDNENKVITFKIGDIVFDLELGQEILVDLDNDGVDGLMVRFHSIPSKNTATLYFASLVKVIQEGGIIYEYEEIFYGFEDLDDSPSLDESMIDDVNEDDLEKNNSGVIPLLIILVLIIGVVILLIRIKKKKRLINEEKP